MSRSVALPPNRRPALSQGHIWEVSPQRLAASTGSPAPPFRTDYRECLWRCDVWMHVSVACPDWSAHLCLIRPFARPCARTSSKTNSSTSSSSEVSSSPLSGRVTAARADASLLLREKPLHTAWRYPQKKPLHESQGKHKCCALSH